MIVVLDEGSRARPAAGALAGPPGRSGPGVGARPRTGRRGLARIERRPRRPCRPPVRAGPAARARPQPDADRGRLGRAGGAPPQGAGLPSGRAAGPGRAGGRRRSPRPSDPSTCRAWPGSGCSWPTGPDRCTGPAPPERLRHELAAGADRARLVRLNVRATARRVPPSAPAQNPVELGDGERVVGHRLMAGAEAVEQELQEAQRRLGGLRVADVGDRAHRHEHHDDVGHLDVGTDRPRLLAAVEDLVEQRGESGRVPSRSSARAGPRSWPASSWAPRCSAARTRRRRPRRPRRRGPPRRSGACAPAPPPPRRRGGRPCSGSGGRASRRRLRPAWRCPPWRPRSPPRRRRRVPRPGSGSD